MRIAAGAAIFACAGLLVVAAPALADPSFEYSPDPVMTGHHVGFEAHDVEGAELAWDLDGDGSIDSDDPRPDFTYTRTGTYQAKLFADDDEPGTHLVARDIVVGQLAAPFISLPGTPLAGQNVLLLYSGQSAVPIDRFDWELDGDGDFNDAVGVVLNRRFPLPGRYVVGLKVTDKDDAYGIGFGEIQVGSTATVTPSSIRVLSPFPIVRIRGRVTKQGALIRRLTAVAPIGARVTVRCNGRGCPFRKSSRLARRAKGASRATTATVRFRRMERRLLRGGTTVKVYVTRDGWIGKYTRWKIRKARPPQRNDLCLTPGVAEPGTCPGA